MSIFSKTLCLFTVVFCLNITGCAVIHFENGEVIPDPNDHGLIGNIFGSDKPEAIDPGSSIRYEKWYHHGFYQIAEISNPLDLNRVCTGLDWNQVTTSTSPVATLISLIDNIILIPASSAGIDLWSHWNMEYSCRYQ
tara:strand:+ start:56682 stop:57092 length:411 start_codon:yes stop_codon:yes gene_type:complete